jgi:protein-S-isoprenylcysteine O-methyltransferase Ste14
MEMEYPFHTAFLLTLLIVVAIRMYYSGYADAVSGVKQNTAGEGLFRIIRPLLGIPVGLSFLAYAIWPPLMQWSQFVLAPEYRWLGAIPAALGIALLFWVQKHLSHNFTGTVQIRPQGHVVKTGPYAYVRHPMYWSFLLIGLGNMLLTANWFIGIGYFLIIFFVMFSRVAIEEKALLDAYGEEYSEYTKHTGKFFPRLFR